MRVGCRSAAGGTSPENQTLMCLCELKLYIRLAFYLWKYITIWMKTRFQIVNLHAITGDTALFMQAVIANMIISCARPPCKCTPSSPVKYGVCVYVCVHWSYMTEKCILFKNLQQSCMKGSWCKKWISTVAIAASFWMIQITAHKFWSPDAEWKNDLRILCWALVPHKAGVGVSKFLR